MTDSELIEHMHARGWRTEAIDVPMIREACKALQASASAEQEPVTWEWRHLDTTNTPHTWSEWARVEPRNRYTDTVDDRVREYQAYIEQGYKYELRALYATPTTSTTGRVDASRVRDEALEEAAKVCESYGAALSAECAREIRSLIGTPKSAEGEGA